MKRALISVYDKSGILEFSKELRDLGYELISTGGTSKLLRENNIDVVDIEDVTKFPEILDGRVKTLNPYIHGGILYRRDDQAHVETIERMSIGPIDIVVNNLYPFEETVKDPKKTEEDIIENIDIGGPSMIRAAAKNYKFTNVIVDPEDYKLVVDELKKNKETSLQTRKYLAKKVFNYTAYYDALISQYFNRIDGDILPDLYTVTYRKEQNLRYGENPHQQASFYKNILGEKGEFSNFEKLHGKELSFNNINDGNGAINVLKEFDEPTVVAVKHNNPCGIGSGENLEIAYDKAYESDKKSIFGGIVAANRVLDEAVAEKISSLFIEIVIAPDYTEKALEILAEKKNIRILKLKDIDYNGNHEMDIKKISGGLLVQEKDKQLLLDDINVVSERLPSSQEMDDLIFAWKAVKNMNSNAIVVARDKATIGIGLGEVNRVWAVKNAVDRSGDRLENSVLASDGFFPFKDSIEEIAKAGIKAIIQPGGSIRDEEVIEEANKHNIAMVFTNIRHFKH